MGAEQAACHVVNLEFGSVPVGYATEQEIREALVFGRVRHRQQACPAFFSG